MLLNWYSFLRNSHKDVEAKYLRIEVLFLFSKLLAHFKCTFLIGYTGQFYKDPIQQRINLLADRTRNQREKRTRIDEMRRIDWHWRNEETMMRAPGQLEAKRRHKHEVNVQLWDVSCMWLPPRNTWSVQLERPENLLTVPRKFIDSPFLNTSSRSVIIPNLKKLTSPFPGFRVEIKLYLFFTTLSCFSLRGVHVKSFEGCLVPGIPNLRQHLPQQ